jgi:hypothetical protein
MNDAAKTTNEGRNTRAAPPLTTLTLALRRT